jgi:hypothetical protein
MLSIIFIINLLTEEKCSRIRKKFLAIDFFLTPIKIFSKGDGFCQIPSYFHKYNITFKCCNVNSCLLYPRDYNVSNGSSGKYGSFQNQLKGRRL